MSPQSRRDVGVPELTARVRASFSLDVATPMRNGAPCPVTVPGLPFGTRLRVLPDHTCATAARHQGCHVADSARRVPDAAPAIGAFGPLVTGW